jgi:hypothetical protein
MGRPIPGGFEGKWGESFLIQEGLRENEKLKLEKEGEMSQIIKMVGQSLADFAQEKEDLGYVDNLSNISRLRDLLKTLEPYRENLSVSEARKVDKIIADSDFYSFFDVYDFEEEGDAKILNVERTLKYYYYIYEQLGIHFSGDFNLTSENFEEPLKQPIKSILLKNIELAGQNNLDPEQLFEKYKPPIGFSDLQKELLHSSGIALDNEFALKLLRKNLVYVLGDNLDSFSGLDKEIGLVLAKGGAYAEVVLLQRDKFNGLELDKTFALGLLRTHHGGKVLIDHIEKFSELDGEVVEALIPGLLEESLETVLKHRDKFPGFVFSKEIVERIDNRLSLNNQSIVRFLDSFDWPKEEYGEDLWKDFKPRFIKVLQNSFPVFTKEDVELLCGKEGKKRKLLSVDILKLNELAKHKLLSELDLSTSSGGKAFFEEYLLNPESKFVHADFAIQDDFIIKNFKEAGEVFGYHNALAYINREGLSYHDALHMISDVVQLFRNSGLTAEQFFGNILSQVQKDDQTYDVGTAHHHFNQLAKNLKNDQFQETIQQARKYKEIDKLQELLTKFSTLPEIFSSWNNLKRYEELKDLLSQSEALEELKDLKKEGGKQKLYAYVETLVFHKSSKVDMHAVMSFWRNPERFIDANDSHAPIEIHQRKKPSNYTSIPHLDLSAVDMRDALVEGRMDELQAFSPLEISYHVPLEDDQSVVTTLPLGELVKKALGSRKEKIAPEAKNFKKLFAALNEVFKPAGLNVLDYVGGRPLPEELKTEIEKKVEALIFDPEIGMSKPQNKFQTFVAKINLKSDPEAVLAGDDTACCMPFGSGKNTVYTFNLNCGLFTLQVKKEDGQSRTIAQSVLTKDCDIGKPVPEVIGALKINQNLAAAISPEALKNSARYLACDNVEVAANFNNSRYQEIIQSIYRDFFEEYMKRFGKAQGLEVAKVVVGRGYSDALTDLPTETNTYIPQAPVSYSDKIDKEVYVLDLTTPPKRSFDKVVSPNAFDKAMPLSNPTSVRGIEAITYEDALPIAYLEGKIYGDNKTLEVGLHNIENALIAKDINNAAKDRPNLSLKYVDSQGLAKGYIFAYEGKLEEAGGDNSVVYISDLAAEKETTLVGAGGKLIQGFVELYRKNYLEQGKLTPVYTEARETTSYKLLKRNLDKICKDLNISFELEEGSSYQSGQDTMYPVLIRPVSQNFFVENKEGFESAV